VNKNEKKTGSSSVAKPSAPKPAERDRPSANFGVMHRVKMAPLANAIDGKKAVALPPVEAPSLEGLSVRVPLRADLTQDDLLRRFHELMREIAVKRDRKVGETVMLGDDVKLDTIGYYGGKIIPFSIRLGMWMELAPLIQLRGFTESIAGEQVGDLLEISLTLPKHYPVIALREKKVVFATKVLAAREVKLPDGESPETLKKLNRGKTLDAVMDSIREELEDQMAAELILEGQDLVLDELAARTKVEIPKALVDEEVRRAWARVEAPLLASRGFNADAQNDAVQAWLDDPPTRAEAVRRLKIALGLKAIAERDGLKLTPEKMEALVERDVSAYGLTKQQVHEGLRESAELTEQVERVAWHLLAVEHVLSKAKISYEGA
jgi:trigger factor